MGNNEEIIYDDEDLLSPIDAAKLVGVSRTTVNYWIRYYGLKADTTPGKRYKIRYADLKLFLAFNKRDKRAKLKRKVSKYKIAIIEPIEATRKTCIRNLQNPISELKKLSPDLILMDINLSDNYEYFSVLDDIRKEIMLKNTLIIIITKRYNEDDVVNGLEKGACDYVQKPVGQNELKARIKNALRFYVDV